MKGVIFTILTIIVLGIGGWYYATEVHSTPIGKILSNPRDYVGKELAVSGTVNERFSFIVIKYFNLQDSSGQIIVVTDQPLPAVGAKVRVKGYLEDSFSLGDQQALVFIENQL